jgi:hypothetical protein
MTLTVRQATLNWLEARQPPPPFELYRRVRRAVEWSDAEGASVPDMLARVALQSMQRAMRSGTDRGAANDLLAADALLTYACEAAAEQGVGPFEEFIQQLDFPAFEAILPESARE